MTREEKIDWLYRLRSEIAIFIPKRWLIPMDNALGAAIEALKEETVSRESYEHEYFLRKELESRVAILEKQIAEQKHLIDAFRSEMERFEPNGIKWFRKYLILLNKVKQARDGIKIEVKFWSESTNGIAKAQSYRCCLGVLEEIIKSEEKE